MGALLTLQTAGNPARVSLPSSGAPAPGGLRPRSAPPLALGPPARPPGRGLCHRGRALGAPVFVLKSDTAPSWGSAPAPRAPAGAARGCWYRDGLERRRCAPGRRQPAPALPAPAPSPSPAAPGRAAPGGKQLFPTAGGRRRQAPQVRPRPIAGVRPAPSPAGRRPPARGEGAERGRAVLATCLPASAAGGTARQPEPRGVPRPRPRRRAHPLTSAPGRASRGPSPRPT